jgi:hypothetical protein
LNLDKDPDIREAYWKGGLLVTLLITIIGIGIVGILILGLIRLLN